MAAKKMGGKTPPKPVKPVPEKGKVGRSTSTAKIGKPFYATPMEQVAGISTQRIKRVSDAVVAPSIKKKKKGM